MADIIKLVQGDSRPILVAVIRDKVAGTPVNIVGATLVLKFREQGATELTATVPGTVVDGAAGACVFNWSEAPNSLHGAAGNYEGEIEITFPDNTVQTLFERLYFYLREQF